MDTNRAIATLLMILLGMGALLILLRLCLSLWQQHRRRNAAPESPDFTRPELRSYPAAPVAEYLGRHAPRESAGQEREFAPLPEARHSEEQHYYQEQLRVRQKRIEELEARCIHLQAEKVRLETILEQHSGLQNQLLEQSKLNWEEASRKQQQEQTQHVLQSLQPLQQQLQYFQQQLEQQHQDGIKNSTRLEHYLQQLQDDTLRLSNDAQGLTEALKGDSKRQGAWGEMVLARTLEQSGLREGLEYQLQKSFVGPDGSVFRPDAVVQFPGQRYLIIDAKVSLKAYEAFLSARDEAERREQLKKHCESLSRHIKELSGKEYQKLLGVQESPDFVLLFCPVEGALAEALRCENSLFEEGFHRHVILVSPTLLFTVLRIVEQLWRYEKQRRNVAALYDQAGKVCDKLSLFCTDMGRVEQQINILHKSVEKAIHRLSGGRHSLLRQAQKLRDLGADTTRELPRSMPDGSRAAASGAATGPGCRSAEQSREYVNATAD